MTTPLYPRFEKRIGDAVEQLLRNQVDPWAFFNSGRPVRLTGFSGRKIEYEGVGFEGSPRHVFWSGYIEPFLEDLVLQQLTAAVIEARERRVDARLLLPEVQGLLLGACRKVFRRMADIDQRLLGRGYTERVPLRPTENEYMRMKEFIDTHIRSELEMWRQRRRYEEWYEQNKFWIWVIGSAVALAGLAVRFL
jgi:hypothetical protein